MHGATDGVVDHTFQPMTLKAAGSPHTPQVQRPTTALQRQTIIFVSVHLSMGEVRHDVQRSDDKWQQHRTVAEVILPRRAVPTVAAHFDPKRRVTSAASCEVRRGRE